MKSNDEFQNFDDAMTRLLKVPHSTVKAKLDAEKASKERKKTKRKRKAPPVKDGAPG